ncbi:MAG: hypothetical protein IMF02_04410 [Proteobacteria bacterium]|nr:hypothetical protein [Pseudomonadota bacterium]
MQTIRRLLFLTGGLLLLSGSVFASDPPTQLHMPDGQLSSHPIRVYVTPDIPESLDPRLRLTGSNEVTKKHTTEDELIKPFVHATNQNWVEIVAGQKVTRTGTLLLFDLRNYPIHPLKAMIRLTPALYRKGSKNDTIWNPVAVGSKDIYLGKSTGVIAYTLALVALLLIFIILISRAVKGKAVFLICGSDGKLSLSRTQMALWTLAIGVVIFGYGLFHREVPEIPDSLVALMGLSLATTGISYRQVSKMTDASGTQPKTTGSAPTTPQADASGGATPAQPTPPVATHARARLGDLVADHLGEISIAKAQMVFWTGLMLVLFLTKSTIDGVLWEVPWQMVTLMGMSQAGYLGPKFIKPKVSVSNGT